MPVTDVKRGRWLVPRLTGEGEGLVPPAVHLEQFVPMLVDYFGDAWWRRGSISLRTVSSTVSGEPVRCCLEPESVSRCRVWMNAEGEELILAGTAALGEDPASELLETFNRTQPAARPGVLSGVRPDARTADLPLRIAAAGVDERLPALTAPMTCYREPSDFGARVVPPASVVDALAAVVFPELAPQELAAEHLAGGEELRHLQGPVFCDHDYRVRGRVLTVVDIGSEEALWYEADLYEADTDHPVARLLRMERFSKRGTLARSAPAVR